MSLPREVQQQLDDMHRQLDALTNDAVRSTRGSIRWHFLPICVLMATPLLLQGGSMIEKGAYLIAALPLGYVALIFFSLFFPGAPGIRHLSEPVGLAWRPNETPDHYHRRVGRACLLAGLLLSVASFVGLPWLYAHGMEKGSQPALEVALIIPVPLLGITLTLWGLGKIIKGAPGVASS